MGGVVPPLALRRAPDGLPAGDEGVTHPPPFRLGRRLLGVGLGAVGWLAYRVLARFPEATEAWVASGPVADLPRLLSRAAGLVPFSLMEVVIVAVLLRQVVGFLGGIGQLRRGEDRLPRAAARGGLRLAQDAGVLVFLFYALWGVSYARPELAAHLGVPASGEVSVEELRVLASAAVEAGNALYLEIHGVPDAGSPTPVVPLGDLRPALARGWERAAARWPIGPLAARTYGDPKPFVTTPLVKRFGIAGMYFPYTGEALFQADLPGPLQPKAVAHEMAHQRGIAREADANALALLVTREVPDARVRYSGVLFLQGQALGALARSAPGVARELARSRLDGVRRDLLAVEEYWDRTRGPVSEVGSRMNDALLRRHGMPEGLASYGGSLWVFLALVRAEGVDAVVPEPTRPGS